SERCANKQNIQLSAKEENGNLLRVREWLCRMRWQNWCPICLFIFYYYFETHYWFICVFQNRKPVVPIKPKPTPVSAPETPRPFLLSLVHITPLNFSQSFYWMKLSEADDVWCLDPRNDVSYDDTPLETPENPNAQFIRVTERWQWLSIDVTGPFQESKGSYSHIVVICDYYTKWIEIFPSEKPNSDFIALLMCDAISRYGFPLGFLTPWGAREIQVNRALSNILMIKEMSLVSRHHQASQLEPHTQYHIADMVEGLLKKYPDSWYVHLPVSVLRFNCSVHPETKHRPLSLHCSEGTKLYTSPREQPLSEDDLAKYTRNQTL
uniref:Integrase catalytic domain-containing protein n=1 Tax=Cyprinus carpio carpio TaxID=630221 RepID=A0A9J8BP30_CYPCA